MNELGLDVTVAAQPVFVVASLRCATGPAVGKCAGPSCACTRSTNKGLPVRKAKARARAWATMLATGLLEAHGRSCRLLEGPQQFPILGFRIPNAAIVSYASSMP